MLNSAVSDFSAKMSKHFHSNSVMPLSEANLSRHTLQSPASREAKLRHILVYVDLQRELIALTEGEQHGGRIHNHYSQSQHRRSVREKKSAIISTSELAQHPSGEDGELADNNTTRGLWHNKNTHPKRSDLTILLHNSTRAEQQVSPTPHQEQQQPQQHAELSSTPIALKHQDSAADSLRQQRLHHQQQQERNTRQMDALDPSLALPRALPRSRLPEYRVSYNSLDDLDAEWQIVENVGPDSPTIPTSHYPVFEFAPGHNESRHALSILASKSGERPIQYRKREDSAEGTVLHKETLQRKTSFEKEKEKKSSRFGRFSLPGRSKKTNSSHQRKESLPEMGKGDAGDEGDVHARSYSILNKDRVRFQEGAAASDVDEGMNPSASMVKRRSKVRQLLSEIFKKNPKQAKAIETPTPVRRAYPGSGHGVMVSASITPRDLPPRAGTSLSHYVRESMVDPLQRELYQIQTPISTQERIVLDDDDHDIVVGNVNIKNNSRRNVDDLQDDADPGDAPFLTQTSLTPPPAASVLRYSTCRPINLDQMLSFHQGTTVEDTSGDHKARPSSNLMPIAGAIKEMTEDAHSAASSGSNSDPFTSHKRLVALTPEQPADLEGVGCRQNTIGISSPSEQVVPSIATA
ncbi:hypothetical protein FBU30_009300 [Linnemannia zychae]|nr:hypothetical protein FBU30_009300 [Linnemannia zychae]